MAKYVKYKGKRYKVTKKLGDWVYTTRKGRRHLFKQVLRKRRR